MRIIQLLCLIFLYSCSSMSNKRITYDKQLHDSFHNESLAGYSTNRLKVIKMFKKEDLNKHKNNFLYWNSIANEQIQKREFSKALFNFKLALGLAKNNIEKSIIFNNQGILFYQLNKKEHALYFLKRSTSLNKHSITPKYNLALLYLDIGFYKRADAILSILHLKHPQDLAITKQYGFALLKNNKPQEALKIFNKYPKELAISHGVTKHIEQIKKQSKNTNQVIANLKESR